MRGLLKAPATRILNSQGEPFKLTYAEKMRNDRLQRQLNQACIENSLAYEIPITTLTTIMKKISEQKFFEVAPADYLPVRVGEGTWSAQLTTYRSFDLSDSFETGIINTGGQNSRLATANTGVDAVNIRVYPWAKAIGWSIFDLEFAAKSGNWDLVTALEKSRKKNWDLGIQRIAFLGADGQNGTSGQCLGLLNQPGVNVNSTLIAKPIADMDPEELTAFTRAVVGAYRSNCQYTAMPSVFVMPESDYTGLASPSSPDFPIKSKLDMLLETFRTVTQKKDFKILPLAYADAANHASVSSIAGKQCYVLLNYDEESIRMDIPLDYTNTLANSLDNFSFQNVGYGQFTGVGLYRPLEVLYFQYAVS